MTETSNVTTPILKALNALPFAICERTIVTQSTTIVTDHYPEHGDRATEKGPRERANAPRAETSNDSLPSDRMEARRE